MPTPIEIVQGPLPVPMLCMYGALMAWEALYEGSIAEKNWGRSVESYCARGSGY